MLKAYSIFKDLDQKACEIITNAGIQLELSQKEERPNKEDLVELLKNYDILIIGVKEKLTQDMLKEINGKKIIATLSIGLDHIDKSFFESEYIKVINCPTANVISVAEHIFSLILSLKKTIVEANDISIKGGTKKDLSRRSQDISGSTIGIIGAGKIAKEVMKIAKVFNMKIVCYTLHPEKHQDLLEQDIQFLDLDELLSIADIITVNIPLNETSQNLISNDKIQLMKKSATFINTSRVEIVDIDALMKYADENEKYPILYLQHGYGENELGWLYQGRLAETVDRLIYSGKIKPMLIVMADGMMRCTEENGSVVHRPELFTEELIEDIMPLVENRYRVKNGGKYHAIAGLSMGSLQTCMTVFNNPGLFEWAGLFSGFMSNIFDGNDTHLENLKQNADSFEHSIRLFFRAMGKDDPFWPVFEKDDRFCEEYGIRCVRKVYDGAHTWNVWRSCIKDFLPLLFREND